MTSEERKDALFLSVLSSVLATAFTIFLGWYFYDLGWDGTWFYIAVFVLVGLIGFNGRLKKLRQKKRDDAIIEIATTLKRS